MTVKKKELPKRLLIRWNEDSGDAFLEVAQSVDDFDLSPGDSVIIGTYILHGKAAGRCTIQFE